MTPVESGAEYDPPVEGNVASDMPPPDDILTRIRDANLGVYRASPIRLKEDVSQEDEVATNYRGRLIYELLQNADDAMAGSGRGSDRIVFRLTETDLWVGNSGRPLTEADVEGLCGIGASTKGNATGPRRASIGHKGMGFKSILEITSQPHAISEDYAFRLGADIAYRGIADLFKEMDEPAPRKAPAMRFPFELEARPQSWADLNASGIRTLFRFPLREDLSAEVRSTLAEQLLGFPVTAILFLKHLERVDIEVALGGSQRTKTWRLSREQQTQAGWQKCPGLAESGLYRVAIASDFADVSFLLAHNADVEIGRNRGGSTSQVWEGIELSEVSLAAQIDEGRPVAIEPAWRVLHVFLPTGETCPYPLLVSGAFSADLARRDVRVTREPDDYNRFLLSAIARLFRDVLIPGLTRDGVTAAEVLSLLDRGCEPLVDCAREAGQALYEAMKKELGEVPFLPSEDPLDPLALNGSVVPPLVDDESFGSAFRELLAKDAGWDGSRFPSRELCAGRLARIAVDHGASELDPGEVPALLTSPSAPSIGLQPHPSGRFQVDPILGILERLWYELDADLAEDLASAVEAHPLFPVAETDGVVVRVVTSDLECFYPPRALKGRVPLEDLSFLMQEICWGSLTPPERNEMLRDHMIAWQGLFDLREFKFPDVMRASVLPALALDVDVNDPSRERLRSFDSLSAICQLSGRTPNSAAPLPYERLGTNRALINLARLPVPCRGKDGVAVEWHPAYRVYFGEDWVGRESVELVVHAIVEAGGEPPDIPTLVSPTDLVGRLSRFSDLQEEEEDVPEDEDEIDIDEDEDRALDTDERERWLRFLSWLGVNRSLRPVSFYGVEDRASGWLTTKFLQRPAGHAFASVGPSTWSTFREEALSVARSGNVSPDAVPYFYSLHDLDHAPVFLDSAARDGGGTVARALFEHLAVNWGDLRRFSKYDSPVVPPGRFPNRRNKPPKAEGRRAEGGR